LIQAWAADAAVMQRLPGCISTQLYRGIRGSCVFLNYAIWESTRHFKQAFNNSEFQSQLAHYPSSAVASPHLFRKVAVSGMCVD
jgi:heme-degrading monooxygenase HmoA